jgi:hypothetical protein
MQENKSLSVERSHLADLMFNVQRMHGDLERSGGNDRRRLENQITATLVDLSTLFVVPKKVRPLEAASN